MSKDEGEVYSTKAPSNEEIIDEVVESCKKIEIEKDKNQNIENTLDENQEEILDEDYVDERILQDLDKSSNPEELEKRKKLATECKDSGNSLFKSGEYDNARQKYTEGLRLCPLEYKEIRSILYGNRGAAKLKQDLKSEAIEDCTKALELNPKYVKVYIRRAKIYRDEAKLEEALEDYKKIVELDPDNSEARAACMQLPNEIRIQNEEVASKMLGQLKQFGNLLLGRFGLSTDNFQVQQDPNTGGYSINFKQ